MAKTDPSIFFDTRAEMCVLGAMMLNPDVAEEVLRTVRAGDFYQHHHIMVYETMVGLLGKGQPVDAVNVASALSTAGCLGKLAGGAAYLYELVAAVPTPANAGHYARTLTEATVRRDLYRAAQRVVGLAETPTPTRTAVEVVGEAETLIRGVVRDDDLGSVTMVGDGLSAILTDLEHGVARQPGLSTGITGLDKLINGLEPGRFYLIAGRPTMGKSILLTDIARIAAIHHHAQVLFNSLEMPARELNGRILSAESRIPHADMDAGRLGDADWDRLRAVVEKAADAPLTVDDRAELTFPELSARCRRHQRLYGLDLIIVDYLQLMKADLRLINRQEQVAELSRGFKLLARDMHVPVVVAAQLNRGLEGRTDKRPQLSDLRESGALEQDADAVILVHRPEFYDENDRPGEADFIVAKNRGGPSGVVAVAAQLHLTRFADLEYGY